MPMQCAMIQKKGLDKVNGGYHSPAQACELLVIEKDGVTLNLDGSELAQLYNFIKPAGTAPTMEDPNGP